MSFFARSVMPRLRRIVGKPQPAAAILRHPFDIEHGVDTSGLLERQHLRTGHRNDAENTAYFGVPPSRFRNAVEAWRTTQDTSPVEAHRFIDIGCGKGRAVMLASQLPFRDVTGVELHPGLAEIARTNLAQWQQSGRAAPASIVCADAVTVLGGLLSGPTLLYLYNPFRAPVLREVLRVIDSAPLTAPVDVVYLYPEYDAVFTEFPRFQRLWYRQIPLSAEDEGDGISSPLDPCSLYRLLP